MASSGYGDIADRVIHEKDQRIKDLASEVEHLRQLVRVKNIRIEELERQADGNQRS